MIAKITIMKVLISCNLYNNIILRYATLIFLSFSPSFFPPIILFFLFDLLECSDTGVLSSRAALWSDLYPHPSDFWVKA